MNRRKDIDIIRGMAMVCVMIGHIFGTYINTEIYTEYKGISQTIFDCIYSFHMPLMFVVSGYVEHMVENKKTVNHPIRKMLFALMLPYTVFSSLVVVMNAVFGIGTCRPIDFLRIFVEPVSGLWFLYALFIFKMAELFCKRMHAKKPLVLLFSLLLMMIAAFYPHLTGIVYEVFAFGLGYCLGYFIYQLEFDSKMIWIGCVMAIGGELIYFRFNELIGKTLVGVAVFLLLEKLFMRKEVSLPALSYIGLYSMVYYVVDGFTNSPTRMVLWRVGVTNYWLVSVISLLVKLLVPTIILWIGKYWEVLLGFFYPTKWKWVQKML